MPHVPSNDEVKVYQVEGGEEEGSSAENLQEVKSSLVTELDDELKVPSVSPGHGIKNSSPFPSKHFEYLTPPFGYVVSPYSHPNVSFDGFSMVNRAPLVQPVHPLSPLSFMVYPKQMHHPPPAHMGIRLNSKTGVPRPPVYPLPTPSQFHPPVFSPEFAQQFAWHPSAMYPGFRSPPYHHLPLPHSKPSPSIPLMKPDRQDIRTPSQQRISPARPPEVEEEADEEADDNVGKKSSSNHIKKPLNAFMLFMKEQRPLVVQECTLKESAAINQILGKKWHSLSREEQGKYYDMARKERQMHMQRYPGWTARDNYAVNAKKKRRKRDKTQEGGDGNSPKKCRARFGLDQQSSWCKPCRRKKKCIRYRGGSAGESEDNAANSPDSPVPDSRCSDDSGHADSSSELGASPAAPLPNFSTEQDVAAPPGVT